VWSIAVVTALTVVAVVFVGGGPIAVVQAAVSAIYVAVVSAPGGELLPSRFVDALVGGVVALVVNQLPLDPDPLAALVKDARPVVDELVEVLDEVAGALESDDRAAAEAALEHARRTDPVVAAFHASLAEGFETARLDPLRRRRLGPLRAYEQAAREVDFAMRDVRVLARATVVLTRTGHRAPPSIVQALRRLSAAVREFGDYLEATGSMRELVQVRRGGRAAGSVSRERDVPANRSRERHVHAKRRAEDGKPQDSVAASAQAVREHALGAVRLAGTALSDGQAWPLVMIVGQIRGMAVDLLRGVGVDRTEVMQATDEALGMPSPDPDAAS
jgi:hypothetical protein